MPDDYGNIHEFEESELIDRVSAYGISIKDEKLLLVQDKISKCWEFPGGGLEAGESIEVGMQREIMEETGLKIDPSKIKFFSKHDGYFYSAVYSQPWHSFRNFYLIEVVGGELLVDGNQDDTVAVGYFSKDEIEKLKIKPKIKEIVDKVLVGH